MRQVKPLLLSVAAALALSACQALAEGDAVVTVRRGHDRDFAQNRDRRTNRNRNRR